MKKHCLLLLIPLVALILVGCDQLELGGGTGSPQTGDEVIEATPVTESGSEEAAETAETDEGEPAAEEEASEEAAAQLEFAPISVDEMGVTTVVPSEWPKIEDDPLLKNAWGPGQYRFVAFHSVAGDNVQAAMAQLLSTTAEELEAGAIDGDYWEEEIGDAMWAMYAIENPNVGLVQTVSMNEQDGTIYVVSLFIESAQKDAILTPVLENFAIEGGADEGETEAVETEADEAETDEAEMDEAEMDEAAESIADEIGELIDVEWVLTAYDDGSGQLASVLPDVDVTALFGADGRISGLAGCNEYVSIYTFEDEILTISLPAMTRIECVDPPGIMLQETGFLGNLTATTSYQIEGSELLLLDETGAAILMFMSS